jgi:hypothetical protein
MSIFSKLKKKLTRGLRKVTPKEIAPILPFLAMAVPGMGGIMGSSMAKFLVPQLLTAAGSARTSGKINPLNQLLAAGSSLAGIDAANKAAMSANIAPSPGSTGAFAATLPHTSTSTAVSNMANPGLLDKTAAMFGKIPGVSKFAEGQKNLASLMPGGDPATFSMSMLAPISAGTTAAGIDQATLAQLEAEAEQARLAGDIQGYRDASAAVAAAIARFSDPLNQYGNNPFFANQGGRVGYDNGSGPMGVQGLSSMMAPLRPNFEISDDDLTRELFSEMMGADASDNVIDADILQAIQNFSEMDSRGNLNKRLGIKKQIIPKRRPDEIVEIDGELVPVFNTTKGVAAPREEDMGVMSMIGQAIQNLVKGDVMNTGMADDYAVTRRLLQNQGGRVNMNMGGGLGSIPQTPAVPQGMQVDGRGGGFIPMGAQERKDDVPAMLAKNEFVMTADAVRAAGGGSVEKGAQKMYDVMNQLESQV